MINLVTINRSVTVSDAEMSHVLCQQSCSLCGTDIQMLLKDGERVWCDYCNIISPRASNRYAHWTANGLVYNDVPSDYIEQAKMLVGAS